MVTESEFDKFLAFIKALHPDVTTKPSEFGYPTPVLICLDAVLAMNRRYKAFVVPRIAAFSKRFPEVRALADLRQMINQYGFNGFQEAWNYRDQKRVQILYELVEWFLDYKRRHDLTDDLDAMRHWAWNADSASGETIDIAGVGSKTSQYLRMLLGFPTTAPDRHIYRAIREAIASDVSEEEARALIERVAAALGVSPLSLDHGIWEAYAADA